MLHTLARLVPWSCAAVLLTVQAGAYFGSANGSAQRLSAAEMQCRVGSACPHIEWPKYEADGKTEKRNYTNCRPDRANACGPNGVTASCAVHPTYANKCVMFAVVHKIERCWRESRNQTNYDCTESGTGEQCAEYRIADKPEDGCGAEGACNDEQAQPCAEGVFKAEYTLCPPTT